MYINYANKSLKIYIWLYCGLSYTHTVARSSECDFGPWQCAAYGGVFFIMLAVMVFYLGQSA